MRLPDLSLPPISLERIRPHWVARLPAVVAAPALKTPFVLQRPLLIRLFEQLFAEPLQSGDFDFLQGKWLQISCDDPRLCWCFSCSAKRRIVMAPLAPADVHIHGSFRGLVALAAQQVDPDTLFFRRELVIEGDTELGLQVKNLLDQVDTSHWPPELRFALRSAADWMALFQPS